MTFLEFLFIFNYEIFQTETENKNVDIFISQV